MVKITDIFAADIPAGFAHCLASECKAATTCIRHLAAEAQPETKGTFLCINPKLTDPTAGTDCTKFLEARYVRCVRGFKTQLSKLSVAEHSAFRNEMCVHFGRSTFYRMRSGTLPLTGGSLDFTVQCFLRHGAAEPVVFDEETEAIDFQEDTVSA